MENTPPKKKQRARWSPPRRRCHATCVRTSSIDSRWKLGPGCILWTYLIDHPGWGCLSVPETYQVCDPEDGRWPGSTICNTYVHKVRAGSSPSRQEGCATHVDITNIDSIPIWGRSMINHDGLWKLCIIIWRLNLTKSKKGNKNKKIHSRTMLSRSQFHDKQAKKARCNLKWMKKMRK